MRNQLLENKFIVLNTVIRYDQQCILITVDYEMNLPVRHILRSNTNALYG